MFRPLAPVIICISISGMPLMERNWPMPTVVGPPLGANMMTIWPDGVTIPCRVWLDTVVLPPR